METTRIFLIASIFCNYWEARYPLESYIKTSIYRGVLVLFMKAIATVSLILIARLPQTFQSCFFFHNLSIAQTHFETSQQAVEAALTAVHGNQACCQAPAPFSLS